MTREKQDLSPEEAALAWLLEMGADEALEPEPRDRFAAPPPAALLPATLPEAPLPESAPPRRGAEAGTSIVAPPPVWQPEPRRPLALDLAIAEARESAAAAGTLAELGAAIAAFEGCALKETARSTVVARGNPDAGVLILGEAPGAEEDREGRPFVGRAGKLLDAMLAAIGLSEEEVYISNMIFWRPPGNRTPEPQEIALCLPFVERHIALLRPRLLLLLGAVATRGLLGRSQGITRDRGQWFDYSSPALARPIPTLATFHPSYLLRRPADKRLAWRDFLAFKAALRAGAQDNQD